MIILTTEMLDRVESIRSAVTTATRASALPEELQLEIRQGINQSIDTTVQITLKAAGNGATLPAPNPLVQF
jgi:hypothetical protein